MGGWLGLYLDRWVSGSLPRWVGVWVFTWVGGWVGVYLDGWVSWSLLRWVGVWVLKWVGVWVFKRVGRCLGLGELSLG